MEGLRGGETRELRELRLQKMEREALDLLEALVLKGVAKEMGTKVGDEIVRQRAQEFLARLKAQFERK